MYKSTPHDRVARNLSLHLVADITVLTNWNQLPAQLTSSKSTPLGPIEIKEFLDVGYQSVTKPQRSHTAMHPCFNEKGLKKDSRWK